jgi:hypothetical protein
VAWPSVSCASDDRFRHQSLSRHHGTPVFLETRHKGYAFATLPLSCGEEEVLGIIEALDGQALELVDGKSESR